MTKHKFKIGDHVLIMAHVMFTYEGNYPVSLTPNAEKYHEPKDGRSGRKRIAVRLVHPKPIRGVVAGYTFKQTGTLDFNFDEPASFFPDKFHRVWAVILTEHEEHRFTKPTHCLEDDLSLSDERP